MIIITVIRVKFLLPRFDKIGDNYRKEVRAMKMDEKELQHLVFLSEVVLTGNKKGLMKETLQCLLYVAKSVQNVDLPESVIAEIKQLTGHIEADLRSENERIRGIQDRLAQANRRNPLG